MGTHWPTLVCLLATSGLTVAEFAGARRAQSVLKPLAAGAFVTQALVAGALGSLYGGAILAALVLSALGDVLLLPRNRPFVFKMGMLAFGLAHGAFAIAFMLMDPTTGAGPVAPYAFAPAFALTVIAIVWLFPKVSKPDRFAIGLYSGVIAAMVWSALLLAGGALPWWVGLAALMFAVSDLFVARDRFVKESPWNSVAISPLYFGAQCLFALSI
ncbi:hypothetical protein GCM10007148_16200 [Parvularcula lutaonensis]|nr:hypothetical protein GCM10007148_16200 [Parvularcula lutaonensis]